MSKFRLALIDKDIIDHLKLNGSLRDQTGRQLTLKFIQEALKDKAISDPAQRFEFTTNDLMITFVAMVEGTLPNPLIEGGGKMLAATLPFMEPFRLESFMGTIKHDTYLGMTSNRRNQLIVEKAIEHAQIICSVHNAHKPAPDFNIDPNGKGLSLVRLHSSCTCLIITLTLGVILVMLLKWMFF